MYAVQFLFKSDRLEVKISDVYIFSSIDEILKVSRFHELREYDLYIDQPLEYKENIINHWMSKGDTKGKKAIELRNYMLANNYPLSFPFIKISEFKEGGKIGKLKAAMIINNHIYMINGLGEDGIYKTIIRELK